MLVSGVRAGRKNVLFAVKGSLGASQVVVDVVLTKDERRGGAIEYKEEQGV